MSATSPKKVLVPIFNRAHYGRLRSVLNAIDNHPDLELQVIVGISSAYGSFFETIRHSKPHSWPLALRWYLRARFISVRSRLNPEAMKHDFLVRHILDDGHRIHAHVPMFLDGGAGDTMARVVGLGLLKMVHVLKKLQPDVVFVNADRFEMMTITLAANYLNIPIAHNEGGDLSGTIDENIRHAITKLSHIHFASTEESRKRVIQMGERPENVFAVGSPAIDVISDLDTNPKNRCINHVKLDEPYLLVLAHPVATESHEDNIALAEHIIAVVEELKMPTIFLGSNVDAGSKGFGSVLRNWLSRGVPDYVHCTKHLSPNEFYVALANTSCALGNSSSFIREGAYFGTPAVLVGSRQRKRERCKNTIEVAPQADTILKAIQEQLKHGRYPKDTRFGDGTAGVKIADILSTHRPVIQKTFHDL